MPGISSSGLLVEIGLDIERIVYIRPTVLIHGVGVLAS
jgi:hypothetical protein